MFELKPKIRALNKLSARPNTNKISALADNLKLDSGVAVILAVLLMGIFLSIALTLSAIFIPKIRTASDAKRSVGALFAAESGIEWCLYVNRVISPPPLVDAHFNSDADGFVYGDDTFRGTSQPTYESGAWAAGGGFNGGGLRVNLGDVNNVDILNMSGGWRQSFSLGAPAPVTVSFRYNLTQTPEYERDELSQALISVDGILYGQPPNNFVAQVVGNGDGGPSITTGWQLFQVDLGTLPAGSHTVIIGGFNNKKTVSDESTTVFIDDVSVTINNPSAPSLPVMSNGATFINGNTNVPFVPADCLVFPIKSLGTYQGVTRTLEISF